MILASRLGFEGLTLGVLADSLGISKSGLYAHFRSKEALILAVFERTIQRFTEHAAPYFEGQPPGLGQLRAYLRSWLDWIAQPLLPAGCPILGAGFEFEDVPGATRERLLEVHRASRARFEAFLRRAIASGELKADLPIPLVLFEVRAIMLAFHEQMRLVQDPEARTIAEEALGGLLLRYLAPRGARTTKKPRAS